MIKYGSLWMWEKTGERKKLRKATRHEIRVGLEEYIESRDLPFSCHSHIYMRLLKDKRKYKCLICDDFMIIS